MIGPCVIGVLSSTSIAAAQAGPSPRALPQETADPDTTSAYEHRPIKQVRHVGLATVDQQFVDNVTRVRANDSYEREAVEKDIQRLTMIGRFSYVGADVELNQDGTVNIVFTFQELPILADVQVIGSQAFAVQELVPLILLRAGDPLDRNLINDAIRRIKDKYEKEGYFVVDITPDEELLEETGILVLEVREGPQVKVREIQFRGNTTFPDKQLQQQIKTKPYIPIFRTGGLRRDQLEADDAALRQFYQNQGYLDARVGSTPLISNDQTAAIVRYQVEEGTRYTIDKIAIEGADRFTTTNLQTAMLIKGGMVYNKDKIDQSVETIRRLYAQLGYLDTRVQIESPRFHSEGDQVDLIFQVNEGIRARVGQVLLRGNILTQDAVVLQRVRRIDPGRYFDQTGVEDTQRLLTESGLFSQATVTILGEPTDEFRDVVIEVAETQTGSILFSAGVSSDSGVIGGINVNQRNFDVRDWPNSTDELLSQRAFRGGGQTLNIALEPGTETSRYSISLREPFFMDTQYSLGGSAQLSERIRETHDEKRTSVSISSGKKFGDIYSASASLVLQKIDIDDIDDDAPVDVFDVAGKSDSDTIGFALIRNTTDSNFFPTKGSRTRLSIEQFGLLYGDFDFTRFDVSYDRFWAVDRDFLSRPTIFRWEVNVGYIPQEDDVPVFDRFYAGGHRTFRGFDFRGVGPRGVRNDTGELGDDSVGGNFKFLTTFEYNFPIDPSGGDLVRAVFFSDMGTIENDVDISAWRISVGTGLRIKLPFFGQAPFALDVGFPILKEETDETRLLSFDLSLPFN